MSRPPPPPAPPHAPFAGAAVGLALGLAAGPWAVPLALLAWTAGPLLLLATALRRARGACLGLLLGLLLVHATSPPAPPAGALPGPGWYAVQGRVRRVFAPTPRAGSFLLDADQLGEGRASVPADLPLRVTLWRGARGEGLPFLAPGMRVACLLRIEGSDAHPGGRVASARLAHRGSLHVLGSGSPGLDAIHGLRRRAARCLDARLAPRDAGLARALVLGDRSRLDARDRRTFSRVGQAHLLAVSGVHVGLLLAGLLLLLRWTGVPARAAWTAGLIAAALYVPFTGAPHSAVRAGAAAALYFAGRLLGRPPRAVAVVSLLAFAILLTDPQALAEASFRLSFAAVLGILALAPRLRAHLVRPRPVVPGLLPVRRTPLRTALGVALAAWIGTAPFVALDIGRLCPAGALVSLPAVPLAAAGIACAFLTLLTAPLPLLPDLAARGFALAASGLRAYLDAAAAGGLVAVPVGPPRPAWWTLYAAGLLLAARGGRRASLAGFLVLGALLLGLLGGHPAAAGDPRTRRAREYDARPAMTPLLPAALAPADPAVLAGVAAGLLLFACASVRPLAWLKPGGAAAAWLLGVAAAWRFGWAGLGGLFAPFVVATLLGRLPGAPRAGARSARQVACNGLPALLGCVLDAIGQPRLGVAFFAGALACLGADTCATEIGVRYGGTPRRLLGRGRLAPGESGGVTPWGLLASLLGSLLAPLAFAALAGGRPAWALAAAGAGVAGALLDSALGGTVQYRGVDPRTGALVETVRAGGERTTHRSGWRWLDNDAVNLVAGLAAGLLAACLLGLLGASGP